MTQSSLRSFGLGLGQIVPKCYHYMPPENTPAAYAVWAEISGTNLAADNTATEGAFTIAVDYYTKTEFDATIDSVTAYLGTFASWRLESVQFEADTGYIHYEWRLDHA